MPLAWPSYQRGPPPILMGHRVAAAPLRRCGRRQMDNHRSSKRPPAIAAPLRAADVTWSLVHAVDPSYWPRALSLRVVMAALYFVLIPAGLLPMSTGWWLASGGSLLIYSIIMLVLYLRHPERVWLHSHLSPVVDIVMITLAVVALARPEYPLWIGYALVISSLSAVRSTRFVLLFSLWTLGVYWAGELALDVTGRAEISWQLSTVVSIMIVFTAANADTISSSNRRLRDMVVAASLTDPLTGLANRRRLRQIVDEHEGGAGSPLAVLMYDIDNFKQLNEEHGHVYADDVLVRVCAELRRVFRGADAVARYGGDELVVLAHVASPDEAVAIGQRSLNHVRDACGVHLSLGVAVYPITAPTVDGAIKAADDALRLAKQAGKDRLVAA